MEFISAEEFLKQPKEVQKVFIDWWQPQLGDLVNKVVYIHGWEYNKVGCIDYEWWEDMISDEDVDINNPEEIKQFVFDYISDFPLLTEGQILKFIEDKGYGIELKYCDGKELLYSLYEFDEGYIGRIKDGEKTVLETYWKVALEIIEEEQKL